MEVLMSLNTLANRCGHFFNADMTPGYEDKPSVNNGYNCNHPDCEDAEDGIGKCLASACPVAYKASCKTCGMAGVQCEEAGKEEDAEYCEDETMVCEIPDEDFDEREMYRVPDGGCTHDCGVCKEGGREMQEFTINIKETLEKQVTVEAETKEDAIRQVERNWRDGEYILDADSFTGVEFHACDDSGE